MLIDKRLTHCFWLQIFSLERISKTFATTQLIFSITGVKFSRFTNIAQHVVLGLFEVFWVKLECLWLCRAELILIKAILLILFVLLGLACIEKFLEFVTLTHPLLLLLQSFDLFLELCVDKIMVDGVHSFLVVL